MQRRDLFFPLLNASMSRFSRRFTSATLEIYWWSESSVLRKVSLQAPDQHALKLSQALCFLILNSFYCMLKYLFSTHFILWNDFLWGRNNECASDVLIPLQSITANMLLLPERNLSQTNSAIYADLKMPVWTLEANLSLVEVSKHAPLSSENFWYLYTDDRMESKI